MIDPSYCQMMARYNAWQNTQIRTAAERLTEAEIRADRGAFFGSIMATLNHVLWADLLWMARFERLTPPEAGLSESTTLTPTLAVWSAERFRMDGRIRQWADRLRAIDLAGDLRYHSVVLGKDFSRPMAQCVVHFFNHQTHHRGQVHAMLTAAGQQTGDTDLVLMPEDDTWL
ncbi:DinB family protein [Shimia sp. SDUM112013]|uniref:DinB family protein n=1 Tax=Shimia sp. SDUM112013 TaxID=3136160 RepID=UPI0032EDA4C3